MLLNLTAQHLLHTLIKAILFNEVVMCWVLSLREEVEGVVTSGEGGPVSNKVVQDCVGVADYGDLICCCPSPDLY